MELVQDNTSGHLQLPWTELAIVLVVAVIVPVKIPPTPSLL